MNGEPQQQYGSSNAGVDAPGMQAVPISKRHQFYIKHTENNTGRLLEGNFTVKKLAIRDLSRVSVRKVQLNGGYHYSDKHPGCGIDEDTDWTNQMIAHLEIGLIQKPMWFDLDQIDDLGLLLKIYSECAKFENEYASPQREAATSVRGSQASSGGTSEQSGAAGSVAEVGRGEVSSTLDP